MRQPQHPVRVAVLAGQQRGAAAGADRRGGERLAEQQALVGETLDVRRRDLVAVRLDVAPGVVRMQVDDVRTQSHVILSSMSGLIVCATQRSGSTLAVRAAEGHGGRRHPQRVLPALQGQRAGRPAAPVPGGRRPIRPCWTCCRRSIRACPRRRSTSTPSGGRGRRPTACSRPRSCGATRRTCGRGSATARSRTSSGRCATCRSMRRDKVAQAVSLWTAIQTQAWRSGDAPVAEPVYSFAAIKHLVTWLTEGERGVDGVAARGASRTSSSTRTSRAIPARRSRSWPAFRRPPRRCSASPGSRSSRLGRRAIEAEAA